MLAVQCISLTTGVNVKTLLIAIGAGIMAFGVIGLMAMAQGVS
jgi:hypothetical protein